MLDSDLSLGTTSFHRREAPIGKNYWGWPNIQVESYWTFNIGVEEEISKEKEMERGGVAHEISLPIHQCMTALTRCEFKNMISWIEMDESSPQECPQEIYCQYQQIRTI